MLIVEKVAQIVFQESYNDDVKHDVDNHHIIYLLSHKLVGIQRNSPELSKFLLDWVTGGWTLDQFRARNLVTYESVPNTSTLKFYKHCLFFIFGLTL